MKSNIKNKLNILIIIILLLPTLSYAQESQEMEKQAQQLTQYVLVYKQRGWSGLAGEAFYGWTIAELQKQEDGSEAVEIIGIIRSPTEGIKQKLIAEMSKEHPEQAEQITEGFKLIDAVGNPIGYVQQKLFTEAAKENPEVATLYIYGSLLQAIGAKPAGPIKQNAPIKFGVDGTNLNFLIFGDPLELNSGSILVTIPRPLKTKEFSIFANKNSNLLFSFSDLKLIKNGFLNFDQRENTRKLNLDLADLDLIDKNFNIIFDSTKLKTSNTDINIKISPELTTNYNYLTTEDNSQFELILARKTLLPSSFLTKKPEQFSLESPNLNLEIIPETKTKLTLSNGIFSTKFLTNKNEKVAFTNEQDLLYQKENNFVKLSAFDAFETLIAPYLKFIKDFEIINKE